VVAGSLVPKLVGEKKSQSNDEIQSMSAGVFFVLYPALAQYMLTVLRDAAASLRISTTSSMRSTAQPCVSVTSTLGAADSVMVDVTETMKTKMEKTSSLVGTSPLLFPVLSLLCRLSPGLEVTGEGKRYVTMLTSYISIRQNASFNY